MPHVRRWDSPGTFHHVFARAFERRTLFESLRQVERFHAILTRASKRFDARFHAVAIVGNHFHLLVESGLVPLSVVMHYIDTCVATAFNRRNERTGYVLQGRFHSIVVEEETYFLELVRYIHLNPLRAGLVRNLTALAASRLTSLSALLGVGTMEYLEIEGVLGRFGSSPDDARPALLDFVAAGVGARSTFDEVMDQALEIAGQRGPIILGSEDFARETRRRIEMAAPEPEPITPNGPFDRLVLATCSAIDVNPSHVLDGLRTPESALARAAIVFLAKRDLRLPFTEIAARLRISVSTACRAWDRGEVVLAEGPSHLRRLRWLVEEE